MQDLAKRFDDKWMPEPNTGCWLWIAHINNMGYGRIFCDNSMKYAHRISWQLHNGRIPQDTQVLHHCDTPSCVNPDHLFLGSHTDNMKDAIAKDRYPSRAGEKNSQSKLTNTIVVAIRNSHSNQRELATKYQVTPELISQIQHRKIWRHI